jgi:hypothetical protein
MIIKWKARIEGLHGCEIEGEFAMDSQRAMLDDLVEARVKAEAIRQLVVSWEKIATR